VVHLPYKLDIGSPHNHARAGACRELESYLDIANKLGAETAVVHADSAAQPKHWNRSTVVTALYESIQRLHKYGVQRGLTVCAENLKGPFVDVSDAPELMARTDASLCLDTGHSFVSGTDGTQQATLFREYGNRIDHVHLNDTRLDDDDEHLPVGLGQVAFEPLVTAMVETNWEGTCTHEVYRVTDAFDYLTTSKQQFDSLRDSAR
jgi:sugar phosphate isomerase/epimerase